MVNRSIGHPSDKEHWGIWVKVKREANTEKRVTRDTGRLQNLPPTVHQTRSVSRGPFPSPLTPFVVCTFAYYVHVGSSAVINVIEPREAVIFTTSKYFLSTRVLNKIITKPRARVRTRALSIIHDVIAFRAQQCRHADALQVASIVIVRPHFYCCYACMR